MQKIDSRILVIDKPNGGLSSARNMGVEFIHGSHLREIITNMQKKRGGGAISLKR